MNVMIVLPLILKKKTLVVEGIEIFLQGVLVIIKLIRDKYIILF
jgi:hypothetical protein